MRADDLKQALQVLESGNWQYVFAATSFAAPVYRSFLKSASGGLEMLFPQHYMSRSQDLPEALHDAGQFYWEKRRRGSARPRCSIKLRPWSRSLGGESMISTPKKTGCVPNWSGRR